MIMRLRILKFNLILIFASICISGFAQNNPDNSQLPASVMDSLKKAGVILNAQPTKTEISLTEEQSIRFLQQRIQPHFWKNTRDPLRIALGQLVFEASHLPYDSSETYLKKYPFDSLKVSWDKFYIWEPLRIKIPVKSASASDVPASNLPFTDTSLVSQVPDSVNLPHLPQTDQLIRPEQVPVMKDTSILVVIDTLHEVSSDYKEFPFTSYNYPYQGDSIFVAVRSLMNFLEARDSSIVNLTGIGAGITPIWINSKSDQMQRYWLKNDLNDSVTLWIGATSRNTLGLYLEQGVNFRRPDRQNNITEAKIDIEKVDKSKLLAVKKIIIKTQYWIYRTEASFALNQASLTNWVKGGENSISISSDITGYADYNNKPLKITSNNFARLKFGLIKSGENNVRKNLDLLETNSKLNHKAFGKFDFSAILLFKSQIAKGFNYTKYKKNGQERDTAILVSRLMNPAIITAGIGLDYKPNKNTSINFSPFSYKGTFVHDTAHIDQTKYGVAADRRSKHEPGASFMISHIYKPTKNISVTNRLQLFTNYINNPLNIDIDWEMILTANINWFTDVRFNTHFIFDDDTKTLDPDNENKKNARVQFKELLGFSFVFRF